VSHHPQNVAPTKVAVAGCAGFIGQHITKHLLERGISVVGADNFCEDLYEATDRRRAIEQMRQLANFEFYEADLLDSIPPAFYECPVWINMAGLAGQARSWQIPERYERANVDLAVALFEGAQSASVRRFVHASTSSVYGEFAEGDETQVFDPCSPYGTTKVEAEGALTKIATGDTDLVILRFFSVYGPGQRSDMGFYKIIEAALRGDEVPVHDRPGLMRDFTYVADVAEAVIAVMDAEVTPWIYNVASSDPTSLDEALAIIEELTGGQMRRRMIETPHGLQTRTSGDTTRLRTATSWRPSTNLRTGLENQVAWQRDFLHHGADSLPA
jgi:nucleoside-diphosphate-sugar epimerase